MSSFNYQGRFRFDNVGQNIFDPAAPATGLGWSPGATHITPISTPVTMGRMLTIIGWSVAAAGLFDAIGAAYGLLPKIWAGLIPDNATPTTAGSEPFITPMIFPGDTSLLDVIWDGQQDPPFPNIGSGNGQNFPYNINHSFSLPVPLEIQSGTQIGMGLWIGPSLLTRATVALSRAQWTVTVQSNEPARR